LAFLSPLASVQRVAVSAHLQRVAAAGGDVEPDWSYLRWQSGRFGRQTLQTLAGGGNVPAGRTWAKQAGDALAQTSRHGSTPEVLTEAGMAGKFVIYPAGKTLPDAFAEYAQTSNQEWRLKNCLNAVGKCMLWIGDMNGDGQDEIVLFGDSNSKSSQLGVLFTSDGSAWRSAGSLYSHASPEAFEPALLQDAKTIPAEWRDLVIGGRRFRTNINN
ncbi:MAG: hypothetical protein JWR60_3992, partial [Polaromonas sp.]|nr:hypothetical protein [Polaromonas sp.]